MPRDATVNDRIKRSDDLEKENPTACLHLLGAFPIRCENGCGVIIALVDSFQSYKRNEHGDFLAICECCASEEGHVHEDDEQPDEAPVCHRKPKVKIN